MYTNSNKPESYSCFKALAIILIGLNGFFAQAHDIPLNQPKEKQLRKQGCLEISAEASWKGMAMKEVTIRIYRGSDLVIEIASTDKKINSFSLQENSNYTLVFSKPGYITRSVSVDTHIPEETSIRQVCRFEFELGMLEEGQPLNSYYLDFPVALVGYNKATERFEYNRGYTDWVRKGSGQALSFSLQENSGK